MFYLKYVVKMYILRPEAWHFIWQFEFPSHHDVRCLFENGQLIGSKRSKQNIWKVWTEDYFQGT